MYLPISCSWCMFCCTFSSSFLSGLLFSPLLPSQVRLHATAPLLYPYRRYPKCPWGQYASPPLVAMALGGSYCSLFVSEKNSVHDLGQKKKMHAMYAENKLFVSYFHMRPTPQKTARDLRQKRIHNLRFCPHPTYAFLITQHGGALHSTTEHNRAQHNTTQCDARYHNFYRCSIPACLLP